MTQQAPAIGTAPPPRFSLAERDRRWADVRRRMQARNLDCLLFPHHTGEWDNYQADSRYLSCIGGGGAATALVFPLEGDPIAVVREARRIDWWRQQQDWISDIRAPSGFRWAAAFQDALAERKVTSGRIGIVGLSEVLRDAEGIAAYGEIESLKAAFPGLQMESATTLVGAARKRKSREEIALMHRAQACASAIGRALAEAARPGASEHTVYADMVAAHIRAGGEVPTMMLFGADRRMWQTHLLPRFRQLQPDDVILVEAEAKYFGYIAQAVETVPLRPFSREEALLLEVSKECLAAVAAAMKPGVGYADLIALWEKTATGSRRRAGRTMGHGLGQGQDGPLTVRRGDAGGAIVEEGDCFVLKPWVENVDGTVSARVGANLVVERHGAATLGAAALGAATPGAALPQPALAEARP